MRVLQRAAKAVRAAWDGRGGARRDRFGRADVDAPRDGCGVAGGPKHATDGVPIGLLRQIFWRRPVQRPAKKRPIDKKETRHWSGAVNTSAERIGAMPGAPRITFLVDREGDSAAMLCTLGATNHDFIARGNWDRTRRGRPVVKGANVDGLRDAARIVRRAMPP